MGRVGSSFAAAAMPPPQVPRAISVAALPTGAGAAQLSSVALPLSLKRALARARKDKKSDFYLRMAPSTAAADAHRPAVGVPVREMLVQAFNFRRDRMAWEFSLHTLFTAIFFAIIYTLDDGGTAANTNQNIYSAFMGQQITATAAGAWQRQRGAAAARRAAAGRCRCCCSAGAAAAAARRAHPSPPPHSPHPASRAQTAPSRR